MIYPYLSMMETMSLTRFDRKNGLPSGSRPQNNAQNDPWRTVSQRLANISRLAVDLVGAAQAVEAAKSELVEGILQYYGTQALITVHPQ